MHPAKSVIAFTTLSGAGYGLIAWLIILSSLTSDIAINTTGLIVSIGIALTLVTVGLLASTFHLGHPERSWRAFTQWRSSWLSREGILAVLCYPVILIWGTHLFDPDFLSIPDKILYVLKFLAFTLPLLTVYATSKIYQTLKPIPAWSNHFTTPLYMFFSLVTGGVLMLALSGFFSMGAYIYKEEIAILFIITAIIKTFYWHRPDAGLTKESATGLGHLGKVTSLEEPHTEENYLLKEMGFKIGRKHSRPLRNIFYITWLLALVSTFFGFSFLALLNATIGIFVERWLFFAEAKHSVILYYGRNNF